jgi:tetratricopeptide (TPR) repeat protein
MMVERHYDDEAILALLEEERLGSDSHLEACPPCAEKLDTYRTVSDVLHEHNVWDTAHVRRDPVPETIATLREFADRMAFEDTQAQKYVKELLAGPRQEWMPRLMTHPEWRTAGMVRRLVSDMRDVVMSTPSDAVEMMSVAVEIADGLCTTTYRPDTVARLRGAAWRERAYSLFYVGSFADALRSTERADLNFSACVVDEYDRARVAVVRALIQRAVEDVDTAIEATRLSAATFERYDDLTRLASARLAEVHLLFSRCQFQNAKSILLDLERRLRFSGDSDVYARVLTNLGFCFWKLGRIEESLRHHDAAAKLFDHLGTQTEAVRIRWNVAAILASAGRIDEALGRFFVLKDTFNDLEMTSEAALVSLDIAELLLARHEFSLVEDLCRTAMNSFQVAGIPYTARALTALAYIRESACHKTATPALAKHVREYIRRLPQNAELLFAPPPADNSSSTLR